VRRITYGHNLFSRPDPSTYYNELHRFWCFVSRVHIAHDNSTCPSEQSHCLSHCRKENCLGFLPLPGYPLHQQLHVIITIITIITAVTIRHSCASFRMSRTNSSCTSSLADAMLAINKTRWLESASELYRPSDRPLTAKLVPTFADRGCHVVSVADSLWQYSRFFLGI
jgi:hypothetical protein